MRPYAAMRSHADAIRHDLSEACQRLDQHQQRLQDLLDTIGPIDIGRGDDSSEESGECA